MISENGKYWSTGINLYWYAKSDGEPGGWGGRLDFDDDGFMNDDTDKGHVSTGGRLFSRYAVKDGKTASGLSVLLDALLADAARLGIEYRHSDGIPNLYYQGDGQDPEFPPPDGWRELLASEAERIGWASPYRLAAAE